MYKYRIYKVYLYNSYISIYVNLYKHIHIFPVNQLSAGKDTATTIQGYITFCKKNISISKDKELAINKENL